MPLPTPNDARRIKAVVETVESQILSNQPQSGDRVYASLQAIIKTRITSDPAVTAASGQVYYPAFTQQNDHEVSESIDHAECWMTDPNRQVLLPGIYLGQESGAYLGLPVLVPATSGQAIPGGLTVQEYPAGTVVTAVTIIQFDARSSDITEVVAGTARWNPIWGDDADVQSVGLDQNNGDPDDIDNFARVNHKHRITIRPDTPDDPFCGEPVLIATGVKIWDCGCDNGAGCWRYLCWCETDGSGSGPPPECEPCICSICTEGPWKWTIVAAGFTGDCAVFNRTWELPCVGLCEWSAGAIANGIGISCRITLDSGGHTMQFEADLGGQELTATFTNDAGDLPDCCSPLTFDIGSCSCDAADVPAPFDCDLCGTTPPLWVLEVSDFTGCYFRFNNPDLNFVPWLLVPASQPCTWASPEAAAAGLSIVFQILPDGTTQLTMEDLAQFPSARVVYHSAAIPALGCCSDVTMTTVSSFCGGAGEVPLPAAVVISPHCQGGPGAGDCPATLTATPDCCIDDPPPDPSCDCPVCPDGMPTWWKFSMQACTGEFIDANGGSWKLDYVGVCQWSQTRGHVTATLDYDASRGTARDWMLEFSNGTAHNRMYVRSAFNCCGDNLFIEGGGEDDHSGVGHTDDLASLEPEGPCSPCEQPPGDNVTPCCPDDPLPDVLEATPSGGTGGCTCMNAVAPVTLTKTLDSPKTWEGTYTGCGGIVSKLRLQCQPVGWRLIYLDSTGTTFNSGCCASTSGSAAVPTSVSCNPLGIAFQAIGIADPIGCCTGTATWTVTRP